MFVIRWLCTVIFIFIFPVGIFAQYTLGNDSVYYENFPGSLELICFQKVFQNEALDGVVNDFENYSFGKPFGYIGISGTFIYSTNRKRYHPGTMSFCHAIPHEVVINDSVSGRISGFNIRYAIFGYDFLKSMRWIDLMIFPGFNTGRVRLFGHSSLEQVNAYFAPCVTIASRFNIGRVSIQFRVEYELDITRSRWRNVWFSSSPKVDLGPMKSTGLNTSFSLGWNF